LLSGKNIRTKVLQRVTFTTASLKAIGNQNIAILGFNPANLFLSKQYL